MIAVLPLPYVYYTLLRIAVFGTGIYCGSLLMETKRRTSYWLFGYALLFNPLLPIYLTREIWLPINLAGAALFACSAVSIRRVAKAGSASTVRKEASP